jgi:hypothetical protein
MSFGRGAAHASLLSDCANAAYIEIEVASAPVGEHDIAAADEAVCASAFERPRLTLSTPSFPLRTWTGCARERVRRFITRSEQPGSRHVRASIPHSSAYSMT